MLFGAIGKRLPLRVARVCGRAVGRLAWRVARRERKKALANIAIAFPEWSEAQRAETIRRMFEHHGMSLFEILWLPNVTAETLRETTDVEGLDKVVEQIRGGRGVVTFTAHCGNWEWLAITTGLHDIPVSVLQRERNEAQINQYIVDMRARVGIRTIDRGTTSSGRELIHAIRRGGGLLAFLIDQNIRTESVKVPFFGRPALTPIGPAKLAVRTEALVVTAFVERQANGRQRVRFFDPIDTKKTDDPVELTARITRHIEEQIRRVPEQWVWMHDRWRERPKWDVGAGDVTATVSAPPSATPPAETP